jgi:hypothetical protein
MSMYLKIRIEDIEWDDHDYDDWSEEEQKAFSELPREMFVVLDTEREKAPTVWNFERDHMLSMDLALTVTDACGFEPCNWCITEVTSHDAWPEGLPENQTVHPIVPKGKKASTHADQAVSAACGSQAPKVVFEIEQNGKMLELVRVPATEHRCSDCLLNSGDSPACGVCEALTNWETRGGRYIFKEKEVSDGR